MTKIHTTKAKPQTSLTLTIEEDGLIKVEGLPDGVTIKAVKITEHSITVEVCGMEVSESGEVTMLFNDDTLLQADAR